MEKHNLIADILVYDNSSKPLYKEDLFKFSNWNITYIHDLKNSGVSKAYNKAAEIGLSENKEWIFLLDQDTIFPKNFLFKYLDAIENIDSPIFVPKLKVKDKIYSPSNYYFKRGFPLNNIKSGFHNLKHKTILNSGTLIKLEVFDEIGGFNENIKLDFSDSYFFDQYRKYYDEFYLLDIECKHGFSDKENNFESSIVRYKYYCDGALEFSNNFSDYMMLFLVVFLRGLKLSFRYKSTKFMCIFINHFILGNEMI
jgi:hypothetical protein